MIRIARLLLSALSAGGLLLGVSAQAEAELAPPGLMVLPPVAQAQEQGSPLLLEFDENGDATISVNSGSPSSLTGMLMVDPADPNGGLGLTYLLPESVITGDVYIFDPSGALSDALRFTDASGDISGDDAGVGARLIYYSDKVPDDSDLLQLADTGFPSNLGSDNLLFGPTEIVGPSGSSFDYQPAGVAYPANNEYLGISDVATAAVPEPSASASLGSAVLLMGLVVLRRRRGKRETLAIVGRRRCNKCREGWVTFADKRRAGHSRQRATRLPLRSAVSARLLPT